jgi:hypothetical protein
MVKSPVDVHSVILDAMHAGAIDPGQTYGRIATRLADAVSAALSPSPDVPAEARADDTDPAPATTGRVDRAALRATAEAAQLIADDVRCLCSWQGGSIYSSGCPRHDPNGKQVRAERHFRSTWHPVMALALLDEADLDKAHREQAESNLSDMLDLYDETLARAEAAEDARDAAVADAAALRATLDRVTAERDEARAAVERGLTWAENAYNHGVSTGGLRSALGGQR